MKINWLKENGNRKKYQKSIFYLLFQFTEEYDMDIEKAMEITRDKKVAQQFCDWSVKNKKLNISVYSIETDEDKHIAFGLDIVEDQYFTKLLIETPDGPIKVR